MAIARALVFEPAVLLMDEPLSNLDARLRQQMRVDLRALRQRLSITTVYVTHDQEEAMVISDRIAVMDAGRIRQIAGPEEIYLRPATRAVAAFFGMPNLLDAKVRGIDRRDAAGTVLRVDGTGRVRQSYFRGSRRMMTVDASGLVLNVDAAPDVKANVGDDVWLRVDVMGAWALRE